MENPFAGAHELDLTRLENAAIAEAVLVLESAFDDIGKDFHVSMGMGWKPAARGDVVFVDDAKASKAHVGRIIVVGERERVMGFEPSMVGVAALSGAADGERGSRGFHKFNGFEESIQKRFTSGRACKCGLSGQKLMERPTFHNVFIMVRCWKSANETSAG